MISRRMFEPKAEGMAAQSADIIPLLDLGPLNAGLSGAREIAPLLRAALEKIGFLIKIEHFFINIQVKTA